MKENLLQMGSYMIDGKVIAMDLWNTIQIKVRKKFREDK